MRTMIVAAHPDDEVLGCGGSIGKLGGVAVFHYVSNYTSRDKIEEAPSIKDANRILGINTRYFCDFSDQKLDTVPFLDLVKALERVLKDVQPDTILTHYEHDLNLDHRLTYQAVITATRPMLGETVKEIYSFEIPSSTEWGYPLSFSPDTFIDISDTWQTKEKALKAYASELREYPHPRSLRGIKLLAEYRGMTVGLPMAEAFKTVRRII